MQDNENLKMKKTLLVGRHGVGKTTLLRIISGIDKKYKGYILNAPKRVSFAFQEYRLFDTLRAIENVHVGRRDAESHKKAREILLSLGFSERDLFLYPSELSGGMKMRVSLARAFFHDSELLLLDEPTKELDDKNAGLILERIRKEAERRCVLMVTHKSEDISALSDIANIINL